MRKIVVTGPESSGKTTLTRSLAKHFKTIWVPEFARSYVQELGRDYEQSDLLEIAKGQIKSEDELATSAKSFLICDTDLLTLKIWQQQKYHRCYQWINDQIRLRSYDAYLLCSPHGISWEEDPLRENPHDRDRLYQVYELHLRHLRKNYLPLVGSRRKRMKEALAFMKRLK